MQNFEQFDDFYQLAHDKPHSIQTILLSDVHLSPDKPALMQAFLALLAHCQSLPNLQNLYILGDWFAAWLGDDVAQLEPMQSWLLPMLARLSELVEREIQVWVMVGNRDFLLGQTFCNRFGGRLITEPYLIEINGEKIRLEHGDGLCIDDKKYQYFRRIIQHRFTKKLLLTLSLDHRQAIAQKLRLQSQKDNQQKSMRIMDVNPAAVEFALHAYKLLIHGHTHRPAFHVVAGTKCRMVLGDWRITVNPDDITPRQSASSSAHSSVKVTTVIGMVLAPAKADASDLQSLPELKLVKFSHPCSSLY